MPPEQQAQSWNLAASLLFHCLILTPKTLPRHRLVVPKYNPARTFTPEGSVGIGGSYMCIYPMDSPGGYQLIGRTLPIWNTFGRAGPFSHQKPWLLRNFDQVCCSTFLLDSRTQCPSSKVE